MKATEIIDVARTLQRDATGPLRGYGDIPVFVARCRGMRDEIVAHPLNGIANTGRDLRRRKVSLSMATRIVSAPRVSAAYATAPTMLSTKSPGPIDTSYFSD